MAQPDNHKESWHLSKEVPIALIATLVGSIITVAFAWSKLDSRIENVEKAQAKAEIVSTASEAKLDRKLDRIETTLIDLKQQFMQSQVDAARGNRK